MEDYIGNYFKKLHKYKRNKHTYVTLREKEVALISSVSDSLKKSSDYEHEHLRPLAEGSSTELNGKRDEILNFYSETSTKLAVLDTTLKTQYHELMDEALIIHKYGHFDKALSLALFVSKLLTLVEGTPYQPIDCFYVGKDNKTYLSYYIIDDRLYKGDYDNSSTYDEHIKFCQEKQAVSLGMCLQDQCPVFQYDVNARFLFQNMFVPESLSYVTDAVNSLINLKIEREDEKVTEETMEIFEEAFYGSIMDRIEANYAKADEAYEQKKQQLKEEYEDNISTIEVTQAGQTQQLKQLQKKFKKPAGTPTNKTE